MLPKPSGALSPSVPKPSTCTRPVAASSTSEGSVAPATPPHIRSRRARQVVPHERAGLVRELDAVVARPALHDPVVEAVGPDQLPWDDDGEHEAEGDRRGHGGHCSNISIHCNNARGGAVEYASMPSDPASRARRYLEHALRPEHRLPDALVRGAAGRGVHRLPADAAGDADGASLLASEPRSRAGAA